MDALQVSPGQVQAQQDFEAALSHVGEANQTPAEIVQPTATEGAAEAPSTVNVGGEELTVDQLQELVSKGKTAKAWEESRPGYNLDMLYADYTRKSMELAEKNRLAQVQAPQIPEVNLAPEEQLLLQKAVSPIIENELQKERDKQALEFFKKSHPEYTDEKKWSGFAMFFNDFFKLPNSVEAQLMTMEMAHQQMFGKAESKKKELETQGAALADLQKMQMASQGGGGQQASSAPSNLTPEQQKHMKAWGFL